MTAPLVIDSGAALSRALIDANRAASYSPGGYCLQHNARWQLNGITSPIGRSGRIAQIALDAWNWSEHQVLDDWNPPDGAPVYFGVSPTRTDRNKAAGDVATAHRRNGIAGCIATDVTGNRVGWISLAGRASQTRRPYLGWTRDFLGAMTTAGALARAALTIDIPEPVFMEGDSDMYILQAPHSSNPKAAYSVLIEPGKATLLTAEAVAHYTSIRLERDGKFYQVVPILGGNARSFDLAVAGRELTSPYGVAYPGELAAKAGA